MNFSERRVCELELRRITLPRTPLNGLVGGKPSSIGALPRERGILGFTRRYAFLAALCPPALGAGAHLEVL
jgi:hypothetical protein